MRHSAAKHPLVVLLVLEITCSSGCSVPSISNRNIFQSYPKGPVVSTFECNLLDEEPHDAVDDCDTASKCDASYFIDASLAKVPECVEKARTCATATQITYGKYLRCGEKRQLLAGFGIATVGATSAAVAAAGLSTLAAAALGSGASAGLAYDYVFYNGQRRQAYSDATLQLECVSSHSRRAGQKAALDSFVSASNSISPQSLDEFRKGWAEELGDYKGTIDSQNELMANLDGDNQCVKAESATGKPLQMKKER